MEHTTRAEDELLEEVLELVDEDNATKPEYIDEHFNPDTYNLGASARRIGYRLGWNNGKTIHLDGTMSEEEIAWLQELPYEMAAAIV